MKRAVSQADTFFGTLHTKPNNWRVGGVALAYFFGVCWCWGVDCVLCVSHSRLRYSRFVHCLFALLWGRTVWWGSAVWA